MKNTDTTPAGGAELAEVIGASAAAMVATAALVSIGFAGAPLTVIAGIGLLVWRERRESR